MFKVSLEYLGSMQENIKKPKLLELFSFKNKNEALKKYKNLLLSYLVGYGAIYDEISEKEHKALLNSKNLDELENLYFEALLNKELDYKISLFKKS